MIHERKDFGQYPDLTHPAVNYPYGGPAPQALGAVEFTLSFLLRLNLVFLILVSSWMEDH